MDIRTVAHSVILYKDEITEDLIDLYSCICVILACILIQMHSFSGLYTLVQVRKDSPRTISDKATAKIRATIFRLGKFLSDMCRFEPHRRFCIVSLSKTHPMLIPGSFQEDSSPYDRKMVDWDEKNQNKKIIIGGLSFIIGRGFIKGDNIL